jgi:uncharacterized membrane protein HdeD (DUF308 family)
MAAYASDKPVLLLKKLSGVLTLLLGLLLTATGLSGGYHGLTAIGLLLLVTGVALLVAKIIRRNPPT